MTYHISRNRDNLGTFSFDEVCRGLADGSFLQSDHYWRAGMGEWKTLDQFKSNEVKENPTPSVSSPPPIPKVSAYREAAIITRTFKGDINQATLAFQKNAEHMAKEGYTPIQQLYVRNTYDLSDFLQALFLCLIFLGIIRFLYMAFIPKSGGQLVVTYKYSGSI